MEKTEKEKIWKARIHKINITLLFLILFLDLGLIVILNLPDSYYVEMSNHYWNYRFKKDSKNFQDDVEVIKVSTNCSRNRTKVQCVYDSIPFNYEQQDVIKRVNGNIVLNPSHFVSRGNRGVCRDISVFRKAVFDKMGIKSKFIFEPYHVYVIAIEGNQTYILNNEYLFQK